MIVELLRRRRLERPSDTRMVFSLSRYRLLMTTESGRELRSVRCDKPIMPGTREEEIAAGLLYANLGKIDGQEDDQTGPAACDAA